MTTLTITPRPRPHRRHPQSPRRSLPRVECALTHTSPWELLVATILSAQCTDVRVNMVTPELFKRFPTPAAMAKATLPELEALIRTTGFFRNKAKSIQGAARKIVADFSGQVPQTLAELITIPGAARKTANVVLGVSFKKPKASSSTPTSSASPAASPGQRRHRPKKSSRS
jgi:endonuclease III